MANFESEVRSVIHELSLVKHSSRKRCQQVFSGANRKWVKLKYKMKIKDSFKTKPYHLVAGVF